MKKIGLMLLIITLALISLEYVFAGCPAGLVGDGNTESPCNITNCTDLNLINNLLIGNYSLNNTIDCSDTLNWNAGAGFSSIPNFDGVLDGRNKTIIHFYSKPTNYGGALFGSLNSSAQVYNLGFENANISTVTNAAILATNNSGNINRVYVKGRMNITFGLTGALVATNYGNINDSYSEVNMFGMAGATSGGLVGRNFGTIKNCYSSGNISGASSVGGLVGSNSGYIYNSFAAGNATASAITYGSLVGANYGTINNSYWYNTSKTFATCYSGGNTGCTMIANSNTGYFFGDVYIHNQPMASWNYYSMWEENSTRFPVLTWEDIGKQLNRTPQWVTIPNNATLEYLIDSLDVNFTGLSEFPYQYFIDDTTNFNINNATGRLTNKTSLSFNSLYYINVTINDTYGKNSTIFEIKVNDTAAPVINSISFYPFYPTYGANITIVANVTDTQYNIPWVNFTITSPSGISFVNSNGTVKDGTAASTLWNSTYQRINETGTWTYNITVYNNTFPAYITTSGSFNITDLVSLDTAMISVPFELNLSSNKSWSLGIRTNSKEWFNFSFNHTIDTKNFTTSLFNATSVVINNETWVYINFTLGTNTTTTLGNYSFNITINRSTLLDSQLYPFNKTFTIPLYVTVAEYIGDIELTSISNYEFISCGETLTSSFSVQNLGNYQLTNCYPFLLNSTGGREGTSSLSGFSLAASATKIIPISYAYTPGVSKTFTFDIECAATPDGFNDTLSGIKPQLTFRTPLSCTSSGGGTGGQKQTEEIPQKQEETIIEAEEIKGICGNKVCELDKGESPWDCPGDCLKNFFEFDKIFCLPFLKCGNWQTSWFNNTIIVVILASVVYGYYRSRKIRRKI